MSEPATNTRAQNQRHRNALQVVRYRLLRTRVRQALETARFRAGLVLGISLVFWVGVFFLFIEGFQFLGDFLGHGSPLYTDTVDAIFNLFFFSLMIMLLFSAGIILYGGLYSSSETNFLLTLPIDTEQVVSYKFQEALIFSSWGFLLLGSPMLVAYGVVSYAPWYYYALLLPLMIAFSAIPCGLGAILCLILVHRLPRIRVHAVSIAALILICLAIYVLWTTFSRPASHLMSNQWFQETLARLKVSENRMLPSWWLSEGLLNAAQRKVEGTPDHPAAQSVLFLLLLFANALFFQLVTSWLGKHVFRTSYSGLATMPTRRRRARAGWLDRLAMTLVRPLPQQMRILLVKDFRVFRRDPVQWSQFLIFFGLLGLYFMKIHHVRYEVDHESWVNLISFLNVAVVGLLLSTFTTRFIFPMISLEGNRFWVLGLLPINRDTILWGKFLFAALGSILPCTLLILLSDLMLRIDPLIIAIHQLTSVILCIGLSGIAVGLGAQMPDLREQSPSKIAAGFGGTVNLVVSAAYIVAVVMLTALPSHFYVIASTHDAPGWLAREHLLRWLFVSSFVAVILGIIATALPLWAGLRAFRRMEF